VLAPALEQLIDACHHVIKIARALFHSTDAVTKTPLIDEL
jgi:hypothetical protein